MDYGRAKTNSLSMPCGNSETSDQCLLYSRKPAKDHENSSEKKKAKIVI